MALQGPSQTDGQMHTYAHTHTHAQLSHLPTGRHPSPDVSPPCCLVSGLPGLPQNSRGPLELGGVSRSGSCPWTLWSPALGSVKARRHGPCDLSAVYHPRGGEHLAPGVCRWDVALLALRLGVSLGKVSAACRIILLMGGLWGADTGASLGSSSPAELAGCQVSHGPCWGGRAWGVGSRSPLAGDGAALLNRGTSRATCGAVGWLSPWHPTP